MRLAKAPALINTTWQRLIRVAWVPSNQSIVTKPLLSIAVPSQWSSALPEPDCSSSIWRECFIFGLKILKNQMIYCSEQHQENKLLSFKYLVCPHRWWIGRGHCCMCCWFPWGEKEEESYKGMASNDLFVLMKKEFRHFYLASQFLMGCLGWVNVGASESEQCASVTDMAQSIFNM